MLQNEQIPLEEWFILVRVYFDMKQTFRGFVSKAWISQMYLESSKEFLIKYFPENS